MLLWHVRHQLVCTVDVHLLCFYVHTYAATVGATVGTETNEHECNVSRSKNKASQPGTDLGRKDAAHLLECPNEKLLNKFVVPHVIHDWRVFGISLGVPANAVETIHREEKDSRYACIRMFTQWLRDGAHQQGVGCTWKELLEAVSDSSGPGVSNEIEQKVTEHLALVQVQQQEQQVSLCPACPILQLVSYTACLTNALQAQVLSTCNIVQHL